MNENYLKENGIDVDHGLELLGDIEMYNETLSDFLEEQETRIPNMKKYLEEGDCENYAVLAHAMKSDSKYLGFTKLIDMAYEHELKGKDNDLEFIKANYDALIEEANKIGEIVRNYLNN